ncbi:hypothetical protein ABFX02_12G101900 [Erythranthe guttata]
MGRSPCCDKLGMKKGPWTPEEDNKLFSYIKQHGHGSWRSLPPKAGLRRCGKSCRLRWINYLRPDIKRGKFSFQEEQTIIHLHAFLGNRWSAIASHLPKRTDNEIKNYWNTHLKKRLTKMGIDPTTHKPMSHALISQPKDLSHMAQWETARLEAESRIVRESKLALSNPNPNPNPNPNYYYHYHYYNKTATAAAAPPPPPPPPPPPRPPCLDILKVWQGMTWTNPRKDHTMVNNNNNGVFTADHGMLMANYTPAPQSDGLTIRESAFLNDGRKTSHEDDQQMKEVIFFEDNKVTDYWSNILNVVNSPIDLHHCF